MNNPAILLICASVLAISSTELQARRLNHPSVEAMQAEVQPASGKAFCNNRTLTGTYSYSDLGYENDKPFSESGLETFDGKGNVVGLGSDSSDPVNGSFDGSYSINGDCTGTVDYGDGIIYNIYVNPDGSAFSFFDTTRGNTLAGQERRISERLILK